jgi:uncharacterized BrkB/YihY/UPF0761 family membrane protein
MLRGLWLKFDRDWGWNLARILAFACLQMLFAVAGLLLITLAAFLRLSGERLEQTTITLLSHLLPDRITGAAVASFERSLQTAPWWLLLIALPIALWEGSRFFVVLESALCVIFRRRQRPFLRQNRVALGMLMLFSALVPVIILSAALAPRIGITSNRSYAAVASLTGVGNQSLAAFLALAAGVAANFTLLLIAYMVVTPGQVSLRSAWPGSLLGALLIQIYVLGFPFYARNVLHPDHFGTIAGFVLVILVFFFAYALFIVIGAEIAAWREGYRAAPRDIPTTLTLAAPPPAGRESDVHNAETLPASALAAAASDVPTVPSAYPPSREIA